MSTIDISAHGAVPYNIHVVTEVPPIEDPRGNLAFGPIYQTTGQPHESNGWLGTHQPIGLPDALALRVPVFHLGEILILSDGGRELGGQGRAPAKWYITTEQVATLDDAIEVSQRTTSA